MNENLWQSFASFFVRLKKLRSKKHRVECCHSQYTVPASAHNDASGCALEIQSMPDMMILDTSHTAGAQHLPCCQSEPCQPIQLQLPRLHIPPPTKEPDCRVIYVREALPFGGQCPNAWHFDVVRTLQMGRRCSVFQVQCRFSGVQAVAKVYPCNVCAYTSHFAHREIKLHKVASQFQQVIPLLAAYEQNGNVILIIEYASEGSLEDLLVHHENLGIRKRTQEWWAADFVITSLVRGLKQLHRVGIVHRDIKPANLLIVSGGRLRIADFGSAIDVSAEPAVTRTGTDGYMAPEVCCCPLKTTPQCGKDRLDIAYGSSADIYSVGALTYELITGLKPPRKLVDHGATCLPFPRFISPECRMFIISAMHPDPNERPDASQLLAHPWITKHVIL